MPCRCSTPGAAGGRFCASCGEPVVLSPAKPAAPRPPPFPENSFLRALRPGPPSADRGAHGTLESMAESGPFGGDSNGKQSPTRRRSKSVESGVVVSNELKSGTDGAVAAGVPALPAYSKGTRSLIAGGSQQPASLPSSSADEHAWTLRKVERYTPRVPAVRSSPHRTGAFLGHRKSNSVSGELSDAAGPPAPPVSASASASTSASSTTGPPSIVPSHRSPVTEDIEPPVVQRPRDRIKRSALAVRMKEQSALERLRDKFTMRHGTSARAAPCPKCGRNFETGQERVFINGVNWHRDCWVRNSRMIVSDCDPEVTTVVNTEVGVKDGASAREQSLNIDEMQCLLDASSIDALNVQPGRDAGDAPSPHSSLGPSLVIETPMKNKKPGKKHWGERLVGLKQSDKMTGVKLKKKYASRDLRLQSFAGTWRNETPTVFDLVDAGFFFAPTDTKLERVRCYACGMIIDFWRPEDKPREVHAVKQPQCPEVCSWPDSSDVLRSAAASEIESASKLPAKARLPPKLFGKTLAEIVAAEDADDFLPSIVRFTVAFVTKHGLDVEGIFRVSPSHDALSRLAKDVEMQPTEQRTNDWFEQRLSKERGDYNDWAHLSASILKKFLRELAAPILTFELYICFIALWDNATYGADDQQRKLKFKDVLSMLPDLNRPLLRLLLDFIALVAEHSSHNKMTINNLAVVFSPGLLRSDEDVSRTMQDSAIVVEIVAFMIHERAFLLS